MLDFVRFVAGVALARRNPYFVGLLTVGALWGGGAGRALAGSCAA